MWVVVGISISSCLQAELCAFYIRILFQLPVIGRHLWLFNSYYTTKCWHRPQRIRGPQKYEASRWKFDSIMFTSWVMHLIHTHCIWASGKWAPSLIVQVLVTSKSIGTGPFVLLDLNNEGVALGILIPSCLKVKLCAFYTHFVSTSGRWAPSLILQFLLHHKVLGQVPMRCWTPQLWG